MNNNLKTKELWITTSGKGENKTQAIEQAFKEMRKKLGNEIAEPVVSIRTQDVILTEVYKEEKQEAFLFFFMKRIRKTWNIKAKIKLEIDYIDFERSNNNV